MLFTYRQHTIAADDIEELYELDSSFSPLVDFVRQWLTGNKIFQFKTSGSTGKPSIIKIHRTQIETSVKATADHLGLKKGEHILLCLSPTYIASIMMAARGIILNMDVHIVKASANPFDEVQRYPLDFASFVPYQIYHIISSGKLSILSKIKNVLIGGAPLNDEAFNELSKLPNNCFMTYGLTETVTHTALMPIKGDPANAVFNLLPNLTIGVDDKDCLWIEGAVTRNKRIQTKDVIELKNHKTFKWMGRNDNIINSGGIKIYSEQVEKLIDVMFKALGLQNSFYIFGEPDEKLGQRVVLAVECDAPIEGLLDKIKPALKSQFTKYHIPRGIRFISEFERTPSGKVKRIKPISITP
ncbi:MAG: AMP-binding protein [Bacteroidota bacterium]